MLSLQRSFERASQTAAELPRIPQLEPLYRNQDMHIHKGDLVMIAGRSGSQKSGLAMFITAMLNQPALYISGDMTPWEASTRIIVPHVTALCKGCPVKDACWAVDGKDAYRYPVETIITAPTEEGKEHQ